VSIFIPPIFKGEIFKNKEGVDTKRLKKTKKAVTYDKALILRHLT
jgi:hypothetical protein